MPKSRSPNRKSKNTIIRNLIRGVADTPAALTLARAASRGRQADTIRWATRTLSITGPLGFLSPRTINNFLRLPFQKELQIEDELEWVVSVIQQFSRQINEHVSISCNFQNLIIGGNEEGALEALSLHEKKIGYTLFAISNRIALTQVIHGLESQKEYVSSIRDSKVAQNVKFLSYWWGVRAEDATSVDSFFAEIKTRKRHWPESESMRAILEHHLLGSLPESGDEAKLLAGAMSTTAVDFYEVFLKVAQAVLVENRLSNDLFLAGAKRVSAAVDDERLLRICTPPTTSRKLTPENVDFTWRNHAVAEGSEVPARPAKNLSELVWRLHADPAAGADSVSARLTNAVQSLARPSSYRKAKADLRKLALLFSHHQIGHWINWFERQPFFDQLNVDVRALQHRSLIMDHLDAEALTALALHPTLAPSPSDDAKAQSHLFGKFSAAMLGRKSMGLSEEKLLAAAPRRRLMIYEGYRSRDGESVLEAAKNLETTERASSRLSTEAMVFGTWWRDGLGSAIGLTTNLLIEEPDLRVWLPIRVLSEALMDSYDSEDAKIADAILLDFAAENDPSSFASERSYAIEDALAQVGVKTPCRYSEQIGEDATAADHYFLHRVCTREALRRTTIFTNSADLLQDRIETLKWVASSGYEGAEQASEQAISLVRSQQVQKGLEVLKGSKLSIDRSPLFQWAKDNVEEDFLRFKDLLATGLYEVDEKLRRAVYDVIEKGDAPTEDLAIPDNEAAALFTRMLRKTVNELATNPEHGLDAYLSLRIRHGTLSGHLRGPVEREHLITRRGADNEYLDNEYWLNQIFNDQSRYDTERLNETLKQFSFKYDDIIDRLAGDYIQVQSATKPRGLLRFDLSAALVSSLLIRTTSDITFEQFFEACEETFWTLVTISLTGVKEEASKAEKEFTEVLQYLGEATALLTGPSIGLLNDASLRAKTGVTSALKELVEWLDTPTERTDLSLTIRELIDISLSTIRGFYPDFQPQMQMDLGQLEETRLSGSARFFTDVFFILFENTLKYSGNDRSPDVSVRVWSEGRFIHFEMRNSVEEISDTDQQRITDARSRVESGEYKNAMRVEGGTGLTKLAKLVGYGETSAGELSFGLSDDELEFIVHFSMEALVPRDEEREAQR